MQAGRIEAGKNQAMLCWALKDVNIPIVLIEVQSIGQPMQNYVKQSEEVGSHN